MLLQYINLSVKELIAMSRVVKRRLYIVLALVMSLILVFAALPSGLSGLQRVKAADIEVKAKHLYLDISNFENKSDWDGKVYLFVDSWGSMKSGTKVSGTDVYEWDCSSWNNTDHKFGFANSNNWDTIKSADYKRTAMSDINLSAVNSAGKYFYWDGSGTSTIDNKKVYNLSYSDTSVDPAAVPPVPAGMKRVYFDASLSALRYSHDNDNSQGDPNTVHKVKNTQCTNIPYKNGSVYYYTYGSGGSKNGVMRKMPGTDVWYADIDDTSKYTNIRFTAWENPTNTDTARYGDGTISTAIPDYDEPVFFADSGDSIVYYEYQDRGGYWGKLGDVRDAGAGKNSDVVPVSKGSFTENENTLYLKSSIYDYYSDYELNGLNRVTYPVNVNQSNNGADSFASHRNWITFRQFSQALSDYYKDNGVPENNTIYTGHYQPNVNKWGYPFSDIAGTLDLYGWNYNGSTENFQVNNNSCKSLGDGNPNKYRYATQGIASSNLINNTDIAMDTSTGSVEMPFFNKAFIEGENSKNTKLGEVYENVAFPFTKVDRDGNGIYYWSFDSAATTLKLRENTNEDNKDFYKYFLETVHMTTIEDAQGNKTEASRAGANTKHDRDATENFDGKATSESENVIWSKNLISSGIAYRDKDGRNDHASNKFGYFPLNDESINENDNAGAAKYNYGFGTKLEFDFGLTNSGNIVITKQDGQRLEAATTFNFSGDDDVWVFVDGKLVLDIGGDHGRTSGCINFSRSNSYDYSYSYKQDNTNNVVVVTNKVKAAHVLVSEVKKSANHGSIYSNIGTEGVDGQYIENPTQDSLWARLGIDSNDTDAINNFYNSKHTLTFFYMERGMWESNMRLQFNFPEHDTLEVGKEVDLDTNKVGEDFKGFFDNDTFNFNIKNLVTHYGAQSSYVSDGYSINQADIRDFGSASSGKLENAVGAYYDLRTKADTGITEEKNKQVSNDGKFALKDDQSAYFSKQFRRGSYIAVEEQLSDADKELYTTTWTISEREDGNVQQTGEGYLLDDKRVEKKDQSSGGNINGYNEEKNPGAILFRSYEKPMDAVDVVLMAKFTNTVNTGKLVIKKAQADGSEPLSGQYTFTVVFSNIGGTNRTDNGAATVTKTCTIGIDGEYTFDGIPVGTRYTITESTSDGSTLDSIDGTENDTTRNGSTVSGIISKDDTKETKGQTDTLTFKNIKRKEVVSVTIVKKWNNVKGVTLPANMSFQLQRSTDAVNWRPVTEYDTFKLAPATDSDVKISGAGTDTVSWTKKIDNLDKFSDDGTTAYHYRIIERSYNNVLLTENNSNYSPNYVVTYDNIRGVASTASESDRTLTVNNTYSPIVMPETGASPLFNFAMIGISAVGIAFVALLIYKRKLQTADVNTEKRGGRRN